MPDLKDGHCKGELEVALRLADVQKLADDKLDANSKHLSDVLEVNNKKLKDLKPLVGARLSADVLAQDKEEETDDEQADDESDGNEDEPLHLGASASSFRSVPSGACVDTNDVDDEQWEMAMAKSTSKSRSAWDDDDEDGGKPQAQPAAQRRTGGKARRA